MFYIFDTCNEITPYLFISHRKGYEVKQVKFRHKQYLMKLKLARLLVRRFEEFYKESMNNYHKKENLIIRCSIF